MKDGKSEAGKGDETSSKHELDDGPGTLGSDGTTRTSSPTVIHPDPVAPLREGRTEPPWAGCEVPPPGWWCSREKGHEGPCAARPGAPLKMVASSAVAPGDVYMISDPVFLGKRYDLKPETHYIPGKYTAKLQLNLVDYEGTSMGCWSAPPEGTSYEHMESDWVTCQCGQVSVPKDKPNDHCPPLLAPSEMVQSGIGGSGLDGLTLLPITDGQGNLVFLSIRFKDAPGLELKLTGSAAEELRDGITAMLERAASEKPPAPTVAPLGRREPAWDSIDAIRDGLEHSHGELDLSKWWVRVPFEHRPDLFPIVQRAFDGFRGTKATKETFERVIYAVYGAVSRYLGDLR